MSMLPLFDCDGRCSGYRANASAQPQDALQILSDYGLNTVRLRLFGPDTFANNSYADLSGTLAMARRAKAAGLAITLDIFYTQWFFGKNTYYLQRRTPPRWHNLSFPELVNAAADYTMTAVKALVDQDTAPASVQIGNEIDCGLFHPWKGQSCSRGAEVCSCKQNWQNLATVITAAAKAVNTAAPEAKIIIQYAASNSVCIRIYMYQSVFVFMELLYTRYDQIRHKRQEHHHHSRTHTRHNNVAWQRRSL